HHGLVREGRVSGLHIGAEFLMGKCITDKRTHHAKGDFRVRQAGEFADGALAELRPMLGKIETAVGGGPAKQNVGEAYASLAPGTHIIHDIIRRPTVPWSGDKADKWRSAPGRGRTR